MTPANFILLHVESVAASSAFYQRLLDAKPIEASPTFVMFVLAGGFKIGLWDRGEVEPMTSGATGAGEIVFSCDSDTDVDATHALWISRQAHILQAPTTMDFGRTFTAADPDGHRLRVYHVADQRV